ncbi:MAG: hypothetical protein ABI475_01785 [Methylophilaceae bacterium]
MNKTALVIQDADCDQSNFKSFLADRNITPDVYSSGGSALAAFKSTRYRYVFVSMDIQREDPLQIISHLRLAEEKLGLPPTLILVSGQLRQPSQSELKKFKISGVIRSHRT